jgi:predicted DNA-binding protein YlxM (UPF0122 family)
MDIRSAKSAKMVEILEKKEKKDLALRDAIKRVKARLDASQNTLRVVKAAGGGKSVSA